MHLWLLLQVQVAVGAEKTDVLPPSLGTSQTSRYSIFCILFYSILYSPSSGSSPRSPSQLDGRCPGPHPDKVSGSPQLAPLSKNEPSFDKLMELIAVSIRVSPEIMSKNQYLAACSCDLVLSVSTQS